MPQIRTESLAHGVEANRYTPVARRGFAALSVVVAIATIGCPSFAVRSVDAKRTPYHQDTVHAYLWNMSEPEPLIVADECGSAGISTVRAQTNYLYWWVGVLTFGGWVPMGLEWRCAEEPGSR